MTTITLRQAQTVDWPVVRALLEANGLPVEGARAHLETFLLAQADQETVGCAGMEPYGDVALLRSVAVAPGLRMQGIGHQLVSGLVEEARRRSFKAVYLLTTTARDYFLGHGFRASHRDAAPSAIKKSAQFQGVCPASASFMVLALQESPLTDLDRLPVAVLGAGPVGLAVAARLIERGLPFFILEAGPTVGANLVEYAHVRLFSPWQYDIDHSMASILEPTDWQTPQAEELPLAGEVVERVLKPFAQLPQVASALQLNTKVLSVTREGFDKVKSAGREKAPFVVRALQGGHTVELKARAVIDSTGTWNTPNPLGAGGLPAIGEKEAAEHIVYGIPDVLGAQRDRYAGKKTLVVGAGHSAANALLYLSELAKEVPGTQLVWSVRSPQLTRVFGGGDADALPARGSLGSSLRLLRDEGGLEFKAGLRIARIERQDGQFSVVGIDAQGQEQRIEFVDEMICATGQRPDLSLMGELRVKLDLWLESNEALGPLIDPNLHSCGTVRPHGHRELGHPEPGLYTVGVKSYGRAPTFLMATGFEQARSVVAAIAGDLEAADRVELELPETGVCSASGSATEGLSVGSCCAASEAVPGQGQACAAQGGGCGPSSRSTSSKSAEPVAASACGFSGGHAQSDATACYTPARQTKVEALSGGGCGEAQAQTRAVQTNHRG